MFRRLWKGGQHQTQNNPSHYFLIYGRYKIPLYSIPRGAFSCSATIMTTRRMWRPTTTVTGNIGREYTCLQEDERVENAFIVKHYPQRRIVAALPRALTNTTSCETGDHRKSRTKLIRSSDHLHPLAFRSAKLKGESSRDEMDKIGNTDAKGFNVMEPICWPDFCTAEDERVRGVELDEEDDDEHSYSTNSYVAKYYHIKSLYPKLRKPVEYRSNNRDQIYLLCDAKKQYSYGDSNRKHLGLSQSFETQETQLEEASETSLCTTDDDDDLSRMRGSSVEGSPIQSGTRKAIKKRVRWLDLESPGCEVVTRVHALDYLSIPSYTCRVVFLLLMDRGPQSSASNYEFLHCEFRQDDRLRVCDALPQITRLVLGTPENPTDKLTPLETQEPFRPFTRLYLDGKELINSLALQDYCLEDGQSTLVAVRDPLVKGRSTADVAAGKQHRDELLRQSSLLLADKCLRRGIRKARIAGRSLQILYGPQGMIEEERRRAERAESGEDVLLDNDYDTDTDVDADVSSNCEHNAVTGWSAFDSLTQNSFDNDELNDITFDVDFFEGTNFFRGTSENQK